MHENYNSSPKFKTQIAPMYIGIRYSIKDTNKINENYVTSITKYIVFMVVLSHLLLYITNYI
jgi:hypothetical protein